MLRAYLQRSSGEVLGLTLQHVGQQLSVQEGQVRMAQLYWEATGEPGHQESMEALMSTVPLMDSLILTRHLPGENHPWQVFSGLVIEAGSDGHTLTVGARDDPATVRLAEETFVHGPSRPDLPAGGAGWVRMQRAEPAAPPVYGYPAGTAAPQAAPAPPPGAVQQ